MKIKKTMVLVAFALVGSAIAEDGFAGEKAANDKDMAIRVSLGVIPGMDEKEYKGASYALDENSGGQFEVLFTRRHWSEDNQNFAWIWGAGLFLANTGGSGNAAPYPGNADQDVSVFGLMGQGGIAYKVADTVILEFQPYLGLGAGTLDIGWDDGGAGYFMMGVKGGAYIPLGENIELGVEVGYQGHAAAAVVDQPGGGTEDLELTGGGLRAAAVLAIKL